MKPQERQIEYINRLQDDLSRQQKRISELEHQLAQAINGQRIEDEQVSPDCINFRTIVRSDGESRVEIRWFTHLAQLDLPTAEQLKGQLNEMIEIARSEGDFVRFVQSEFKDAGRTSVLLHAFRSFRESERK